MESLKETLPQTTEIEEIFDKIRSYLEGYFLFTDDDEPFVRLL